MPRYPFPTDPEVVLTTERLRLEPVRAELAPLLFDLWQDAAVYRFVPEEPPPSVEWLTERYRALETRESGDGTQAWLQWAVGLLTEPTYVGRVEATVEPGRPALLAWMFGSAFWGQGLASESVARVLVELATRWGVTEVEVEVDERNAPSLALAGRLGFVEHARVEDADFFRGSTSHERHLRRSVVDLAAAFGDAGYGG